MANLPSVSVSVQMAAVERKLANLRSGGVLRQLPDSTARMYTFGPPIPSTLSLSQAKAAREVAAAEVAADVAAVNAGLFPPTTRQIAVAEVAEEVAAAKAGLLPTSIPSTVAMVEAANTANLKNREAANAQLAAEVAANSAYAAEEVAKAAAVRALSANQVATVKNAALKEATAVRELTEAEAAKMRAVAASTQVQADDRALAARESAAIAAEASAQWRRQRLEAVQVAAAELNLARANLTAQEAAIVAAKEVVAVSANQELRQRIALEDIARADLVAADAALLGAPKLDYWRRPAAAALSAEWRLRRIEDAARLQRASSELNLEKTLAGKIAAQEAASRQAAVAAAQAAADLRRRRLEDTARIQLAAAELNLEKKAVQEAAVAAELSLEKKVLEDKARAEVAAAAEAVGLERKVLQDKARAEVAVAEAALLQSRALEEQERLQRARLGGLPFATLQQRVIEDKARAEVAAVDAALLKERVFEDKVRSDVARAEVLADAAILKEQAFLDKTRADLTVAEAVVERRRQIEEAARIQAKLNLEKNLAKGPLSVNLAAQEAAAIAANQDLRNRIALEDLARGDLAATEAALSADAITAAASLEWRRRRLEENTRAQMKAAKTIAEAEASKLKLANEIAEQDNLLISTIAGYPYPAVNPILNYVTTKNFSRPRSVSPPRSTTSSTSKQQACLSTNSALDDIKALQATNRAIKKFGDGVSEVSTGLIANEDGPASISSPSLAQSLKDVPYASFQSPKDVPITSLNSKIIDYPRKASPSPGSSPTTRKAAINLEGPEPEPTINGRLSPLKSPAQRLQVSRMLDQTKAEILKLEADAQVDAILRAEEKVAKTAEDAYLRSIKSTFAAQKAVEKDAELMLVAQAKSAEDAYLNSIKSALATQKAVEKQSRQDLARAAVRAQAAEEAVLMEKVAENVVAAEEALLPLSERVDWFSRRDDAVAPWRMFALGSPAANAPRRLFEPRRN